MQKVPIILHHLPHQAAGVPPTTCKLAKHLHAPRSWQMTEWEQNQVMDWAQKTPWITMIQNRAVNWLQALCSNPQTILPPLFSPGSLSTTLLYFGLIPIAKSARSISNPADETQISITCCCSQGRNVGCIAAESFLSFVSCLVHFLAGFDTVLWTVPSAPPTQQTWIILPHGLNFATWN